MLHDIASPEDIRLLVDTFYDRVKADPTIGPIFLEKVQDWSAHLPKMYTFWGSLLLEEHSYNGNPFAKHAPLPIFTHHFEAWQALFSRTVDDLFAGPKADEAKTRAESIGHIFDGKLKMIRAFNEAADLEFTGGHPS